MLFFNSHNSRIVFTFTHLRWWQWLMGGLGLFLILFALQNMIGSFAEMESRVAWMIGLFVGLPGIILLAIAVVMQFTGGKSTEEA